MKGNSTLFDNKTFGKTLIIVLLFYTLFASSYSAFAQTTLTKSIASSSDDAEEAGSDATGSYSPGHIDLTSSDIELITDNDQSGGYSGGTQKVGLRFTEITIPSGATITSAYLTFRAISADAPMTNSDATNLTIKGQLIANAPTFTSTTNNISNRTLTTASTSWTPASWTSGTNYNSPSLVSIIQEILDQSTWASGNAIAIIITGSGHRASQAYDTNPNTAAKLVITYTINSIKTWTGNVSSDWENASNWTPSGVPDYDTVIVPTSPSGGRFPVLGNGNPDPLRIYTLKIEPGATFTQNGGYLILHKDLIINKAGSSSGTYYQQNGTMLLYGDWINHGMYQSIYGWTIIGDQSSLSDFASGVNEFYDLSISTLTRPKFDNFPSSLIRIKGSFFNYGDYSVSSNTTFLFNGTGVQSIYNQTSTGNTALGNFVINKSSGSVLLRTALLEISGNVLVENGILDLDTCTLRRTTLGGNFTLHDNTSLRIGGNKSFPANFSAANLSASSTVEYFGGNQTVASLNYGNLILRGNFTEYSPGSVKYLSPGVTGIAGGNSFSENTLIDSRSNSSTVNYNSNEDQYILPINYYNLTLSNAGTKYFVDGTTGIAGELTINGSALPDAVTFEDTINYNGTDQTVRYGFVNKNLRISGESSVTSLVGFTVTNSLIIGSNSSLNMNNNALTVSGQLLNNGTYVSTNPAGSMSFFSRTSGDFTSLSTWANSGYSGTATSRLPGTTVNDVINIGDGKSITLNANVNDLGTILIDSSGIFNHTNGVLKAKELNIKKDGVFNQSSGELQISHNLIIPLNSTLSSTSGTVRFTGVFDSETEYAGNVQFNNLIIDTGADYCLENDDTIKVMGSYTNNNSTLDNEEGTLIFNGTTPQTIYSASSPASTKTVCGNLVVTNSNVTLLSDVGIHTSLNIINGGHINKNGNEIYLNGVLYTGPTPVELVGFIASASNNTAQLTWQTITEVNNYGFEIERSTNNQTFTKYSFVQGSGNSNSAKHYSFTDNNLQNGTYYYRLKQLDTDGQFSYSNVVKATIDYTPKNFALSQNYPNPFNPSTKISWQSPIASWQTLKVYDILGNEVATLVDEFREAGSYEIDFSASQLTSGVYVYKIIAGNFSDTKKMILSK